MSLIPLCQVRHRHQSREEAGGGGQKKKSRRQLWPNNESYGGFGRYNHLLTVRGQHCPRTAPSMVFRFRPVEHTRDCDRAGMFSPRDAAESRDTMPVCR